MSEALREWPEHQSERQQALQRIGGHLWHRIGSTARNGAETLDFWNAEDALDGQREVREIGV